MRFSPLNILLIYVLLAACAHQPTGPSKRPSASAESRQSEAAPGAELNRGQIGTLGDLTADAVADDSATNADETARLQAPTDLLQRLRDGFSLPAMESRHRDQHFEWSVKHPTYLANLFTRGSPYLHHIIEQIEKRDMPMEIALLPAIESAYKPNAVSRSRAAGIWQFMPATGRHFGLRQDWWYDGRRDLLASTDAALDYLTALHKRFDNDWFLALAAYNAGEGTVQKAINANRRRGKPTDYTALNLRQETRRYVPKLLALRDVVAQQLEIDLNLPTIADVAYFGVVELPGQVDIQEVANQSGVDIAELHHLNAGFLRWATAPAGPHRLLVPLTKLEDVQAAVAQQQHLAYQHHRVEPGDTLSQIARRYTVSVAALRATNNLQSNRIHAGKSLLIPVAADKTIARSHTQSVRMVDANAVDANAVDAEAADKKLIHRVQSGDTLWSIARRYRVKVQQLLTWNRLEINQILSLDQPVTVFTR